MSAPESLGAYRIRGVLGRGGMGVVYRAEHERTGQPAAVKTVSLHDAALLGSIRREIHALSRLRHPGIVGILDEGVHDGLPWYAMELLEGTSLRRAATPEAAAIPEPAASTAPTTVLDGGGGEAPTAWLGGVDLPAAAAPRRASCPRLEALSIARAICGPLAFLHGEGVTHGDLKPENVFLMRGRPPVLVDFGLAAWFGGERGREALEASTGIAGTIWYISPEQLRGEIPDPRADLYALGCILHELLTGTPPFTGDSPVTVIARHLHDVAPPPSTLTPDVPPELDALVARLLDKDPRRRAGSADAVADALGRMGAGAPRWPSPPPPARPYLYRASLAGRGAILAEIDALAPRRERPATRLVLLGGEVGIGKTRLGREIVSRTLAGDATAAVGAGAPDALATLRRPLTTLADRCRAAGPALTRRLLEGRGRLARHEPALAALPGAEPGTGAEPLPPDEERLALAGDAAEALREWARHEPLVLVLDDLHDADEATLAVLGLLARNDPAAPLLIVGLYRSDAASRLDRLLPSAHLHRRLERLAPADVAAITADMLALDDIPGPLVPWLHRQSAGVPFLVAEHLRAALAGGLLRREPDGSWAVSLDEADDAHRLDALPLPRAMADLAAARLAGLGPHARRVAEAASVLGREAPAALLHDLAALPEDAWMDAVTELLAREAMEEPRPGILRFTYDAIRDLAAAACPRDRWRRDHHARAEALEALPEPERSAHLGDLGRHREEAMEPRRARDAYLAAARRATARGALEEAAASFAGAARQPLAIDPDGIAARREWGAVLALRGDASQALEVQEAALRDARALGIGGEIARCLTALAETYRNTARAARALPLLEEALARHRESQDAAGEAAALSGLGLVTRDVGRRDDAIPLHRGAQDLYRRLGDRRAEAREISFLGALARLKGDLADACARHEHARAIFREEGSARLEAVELGNIATCQQVMGNLELALDLYRETLALMQACGDRRSAAICYGNLAAIHHQLGHADEAAELYGRAIAAGVKVGDRRMEAVARGNLALHLAEQGLSEQAEREFRDVLQTSRELGDRMTEAHSLANLGMLYLDLRRRPEARAAFEEALRLERASGSRDYEVHCLENLALMDHTDGEVDTSLGRLEEAVRVASAARDPIGEASAHIATSVVLRRAKGDREGVGRHLARAGEILAVHGSVRASCRLLCERSRVAIWDGEPADELLRRAVALHESLQARSDRVMQEDIDDLRGVMAQAAGGARFFRGEPWSALPEGLREWLRRTGQA